MKDFDTKTMNDPAIKSGHITPAMVDKIGLVALASAGVLTVLTIIIGFVAVLSVIL